MHEILRTTDPVTISHAQAVLKGEGIDCFEMDVNISVLEGSIGILPRRLLVRHCDYLAAERALIDNGIDLT